MVRELSINRFLFLILFALFFSLIPFKTSRAAADTTAPTVNNIAVKTKTVTDSSKKLIIEMDVSDQGTGVDYVGIQLVFPHGNSTYFYDIGYSTNSPVYSGHIVITKDITNDEQDFYNPRPGTYSISSVTVTDCANNRRIYNTGKENYS